ncbi:MAG: phage major capsid protein [FCB group bacterium]|nr:phage major capsid protein [FCB group bacterium]
MDDNKLNSVVTAVNDLADGIDAKIEAKIETALENHSTEPVKNALDEMETKIGDLTKQVENAHTANDNLKAHLRALRPITTANDAKTVYEGLGHYVLGTMGGNAKSRKWLNDHGIMAAMSEDTSATGGALVPDAFVPELIDLLNSYGVARQNVRVVPMSSDTATWPQITANVTVYKPGESVAITASNPTFGNVPLVAQKLAALTAISSELEEDAALAVGQIVATSMTSALAKAEDQAVFLGDGTSTYWGYTGITGAFAGITSYTAGTGGLNIAESGDNTYAEVTIAALRGVVKNLPSRFERNAKWYMSKTVFHDICVRLAQAAGGAYMAEFHQLRGKTFMGYPVEYVDVMPSSEANSQICMFFGDLEAGVFLGDRRKLNIVQDRSVYFAEDQIGIRATERFAINVFGHGDSSTAGPICGLILTAS